MATAAVVVNNVMLLQAASRYGKPSDPDGPDPTPLWLLVLLAAVLVVLVAGGAAGWIV